MNPQIIRDLAIEQRKTINALAQHLGISPAGVQHIIRNRSTSTITLEHIAEFFNVHPSVFFDDFPIKLESPSPIQECNNCKVKDEKIELLTDNIRSMRLTIETLQDLLKRT